MKTLVSMLALFTSIVISSSCSADDLLEKQKHLAYSMKTSFMSEYLFSIGSVVDSPISVNEVCVSYGDWYGGIWTSTGLDGADYGETYADELDFYAGWARTFGGVKLDLSSSYYAISKLDKANDDLWVIEPEISFPKCPFVQPYVRGRYFGQVGSQSAKPGFFCFAGVRKSIELGKGPSQRPFLLNLQLSTAYAGGALKNSTGFVYGRVTSSLDVPLLRRWTLSPSVIYQVAAPGQRSNPSGFTDGNKIVYGIGLGCSF